MNNTFHFKVTLNDSKPSIWRTFRVEDSYRMDRFHQVIQIVMGWHNAHLHHFKIGERFMGIRFNDGMDLPDMEDENRLYLKDFSLQKGDKFEYLYDFGDSWYHTIEVLAVNASENSSLLCTGGKRACPPEDCGGIYSYNELVKVLKKPAHPDYKSWTNWLGDDFDPADFSIDSINGELAKFGAWHNKHPRKKSTPWHQI